MKGFLMNLEVMEEFFLRVQDLPKGQDTEENRLKIMYDLVHEYNVKILKEKQLKEALTGKKVLHVRNTK